MGRSKQFRIILIHSSRGKSFDFDSNSFKKESFQRQLKLRSTPMIMHFKTAFHMVDTKTPVWHPRKNVIVFGGDDYIIAIKTVGNI